MRANAPARLANVPPGGAIGWPLAPSLPFPFPVHSLSAANVSHPGAKGAELGAGSAEALRSCGRMRSNAPCTKAKGPDDLASGQLGEAAVDRMAVRLCRPV